jgi:hypothetical protein
MKYFKREHGFGLRGRGNQVVIGDDPLSGVANLFDIGLVFIVGLIVTIFSAYNLQDMLSEKSEFTMLKINKNNEMEIITKKGSKIKAMKVSKQKAKGRGERLGIAYKLEDGSMVYVPEE